MKKNNRFFQLFTLTLLLLGAGSVWALDADGDGSDAVEEGLAGTSDNDATVRPFWDSTYDSPWHDYVVSRVGDANNDGYEDFAIGYPLAGPSAEGNFKLVSGQSGEVLKSYVPVGPEVSNDEIGQNISPLGDINSDGYDDFLVNARKYFLVFHGAVDGFSYPPASYSNFGGASDIGNAGDVNNDGTNDLVMDTRSADVGGINTGSVFVLSGVDYSQIHRFDGAITNGFLGRTSYLGDVNGDDYADILARAGGSSCNDCSYVRIFDGQTGSILRTHGATWGANFWLNAVGVSDINDDGYNDYAISNIDGTATQGQVTIHSGLTGVALHTFVDTTDVGTSFGTAIKMLGDFNGNGSVDFLISAPDDDSVALNSGATYIYDLSEGLIFTLQGKISGERLGAQIEILNDLDGDGKMELLLGRHSNDVLLVLSQDLLNDIDGDFIINSADADDDGDGLTDDFEIANGLDPLISNTGITFDTDGDGITDDKEDVLGTDSSLPDTDGDGVNDDVELFSWCTDPGAQDTDDDGQNDNVDVEPNSNATCSMPLNGLYRGINFQQNQ